MAMKLGNLGSTDIVNFQDFEAFVRESEIDMLDPHHRNEFAERTAGVKNQLPIRKTKALERFARDGVLAQQLSFRPKAAENAADCAGGWIDICQQVAILSQTEVVDMVGGNGNLPDGANRSGSLWAVQANDPGATDGIPLGKPFDWLRESQRFLKQIAALGAVIAFINRAFKPLQKPFDGDGFAVKKDQAVAVLVITHQIGCLLYTSRCV